MGLLKAALVKDILNLKTISTSLVQDTKTVYGVVDADKSIIRCWQKNNGLLLLTEKPPNVLIPEKLEKILTIHKKYKIVYGGRGGGKTLTLATLLGCAVKDDGIKVMCFREVQKSLQESVYKAIQGQMTSLGIGGYLYRESKGEIRRANGGLFSFWGLRSNITNMKSLYGYAKFWVEEAESTSQESLDVMGPTLRAVDNAEIWISLNIKSSQGAVYKNFIGPHLRQIQKNGFYEDEYTLVININYWDNPWFTGDESLSQELEKDEKRVASGIMPQSKFDHIWRGEPDDDVDNAIICAEWFDTAIDAHTKKGFKALGIKIISHDPSDTGPDPKGICLRQGSVILDVDDWDSGDINAGGDWATDWAIKHRADHFVWDCDGMGVGLKRQVTEALSGRPITTSMFKGSQSPDFPKSIYTGVSESRFVHNPKNNEETFKNKRAQYYWELRERFYNTYRAIKLGEYVDPTTMISISSDIKDISGLRAEITKIPLKPNGNGLIQIATKDEMKKMQIPSPNRADSIMMSLKAPPIIERAKPIIPPPMRPMGRR